jgi:hypothetical protein
MRRFLRAEVLVAVVLSIVLAGAAGVLLAVNGGHHPASALEVEGEHEPTVGQCGVERWSIKTGTDSGAKRVNQKAVTATNIFHLRSLVPPSSIPLTSRVKPVETTEYQVPATLLRIKQEDDSDYHLVLSDSGGRTMIAEIPAPQCVASSSPFLPSITYVRRIFTERYHPGTDWQDVHDAVTVRGVGFFDFLHGQSGVAPNGIELHPVLGMRWGAAATQPKPVSSVGTFHLHVQPQTVGPGQKVSIWVSSPHWPRGAKVTIAFTSAHHAWSSSASFENRCCFAIHVPILKKVHGKEQASITATVTTPAGKTVLHGHFWIRGAKASSSGTPPPPPGSGSNNFFVQASVDPPSMPYDYAPTLRAKTGPGAVCTASVSYTTGRSPASFNGSAQTAGSDGTVSWSWHEETKGSGGTATVTCSYHGQSKTATASFSVTR